MATINIESSPCLGYNGHGVPYEEFSCVYPSLGRFYLPWEKYYDPFEVLKWMEARPFFPVATCLLYATLIVLGRRYFASRQAWSLRPPLAAWNFLLSTFSGIGMMRTLPQLVHNLSTMPFRDNLCLNPQSTYGSGSSGLWVQLFVLSKFPELLDTFFIVVHKKPLIFLHWYHHITVLLYCWHSYVTKSPPGIFFVVMNYTVHWFMYGYYFLMAIRRRPKWLHPMMVTTLQISQMVVGVAVTLLGFHYHRQSVAAAANNTNKEELACAIESQNNTAAFLMYGSYLFLFMQFFVGRYVQSQQQQQRKTKVVVSAKKQE